MTPETLQHFNNNMNKISKTITKLRGKRDEANKGLRIRRKSKK